MNTQKQAPPWIPIGGKAQIEHPDGVLTHVTIESAEIRSYSTGELIHFSLKDTWGEFWFLPMKPVAPNLFAGYTPKGDPTGVALLVNQEKE